MKKRVALVLALGAAPLVLAATPAVASSTDCKPGNVGRLSCRTMDEDAIKRIRVIDSETGKPVLTKDERNKVLRFDCAAPVTDKRYSFADDGGRFRIQVIDCAGNIDNFVYGGQV